MSLSPSQRWNESLLALPKFMLIDAHVSDYDELVADEAPMDVKLHRDVPPCPAAGCSSSSGYMTTGPMPCASMLVGLARRADGPGVCWPGLGGSFVERTTSVAPGAVWSRAAARAAVAMATDSIPAATIRMSSVDYDTVMVPSR